MRHPVSDKAASTDPERYYGQMLHKISLIHPNASIEKHRAFAAAMTFLILNQNFGQGGPSARELVAKNYYQNMSLTEKLLFEALSREDGLIFGSIQKIHRQCFRNFVTRDNDEEDVRNLTINQ